MPGSQASAQVHGRSIAIAFGLLVGVAPGLARAEPPLEPGPRAAAPTPTSMPQASPASEPAPLFPYVIGALGLSGLSVAAVTGFLAMNQQGIVEDHCSPTLRLCDGAGKQASETGRTLRDISTVAAIVGGVGVGLSAYLLLTAPARPNQVAVSISVDWASPKAALVAHF